MRSNCTPHIFTVDVENWYDGIPCLSLQGLSTGSRFTGNLERMIALLSERDVRATFFWLGEVASEHPELVRKVMDSGHEIGCHGWDHTPVELLGPDRFRWDTGRALETIASITGEPVLSYRAPFFSVGKKTMWALDVLCELGIKYDSSILPARSWRCGYPKFPRGITRITTGSGVVTEVPVSTVTASGTRVPVGGGAWFRILPMWFTLRGFSSLAAEGTTGVFYIHPWELDTGQPLRMFEPRAWLCHYLNIRSTRKRLDILLERFRFTSIGAYFNQGEQDDRSAGKAQDHSIQVRNG